MNSSLQYEFVVHCYNLPVFQSHFLDIIDFDHLGVVHKNTCIMRRCIHVKAHESMHSKQVVSMYLQSLILGVKHQPNAILSQVNNHVLIKGKLMQLGGN